MAQQRVRTNIAQASVKEVISLTTVVGFTVATIPTGCVVAHVTVLGADIRYYLDGSTPTTTLGHYVYAPATFDVVGENDIRNFKMVSVSGTATITVSYEVEA